MNVNEILKTKKINHTSMREKILTIMTNKGTITQKEIMGLADFDLNRITLYRTLREFMKKGVVVRIYDDRGVEKFFLNAHGQSDHIHFECVKCGSLFSFTSKEFKYPLLPKGYVAKEKKLFITGICNKCSAADV